MRLLPVELQIATVYNTATNNNGNPRADQSGGEMEIKEMKNVLYLLEMGMNDSTINTDVKNHRVSVLENIDISYKGKTYNMFFEFLQGKHWHYRKENLRTGKPLKHPVYTVDVIDGMYIDTQYEKLEGYWNDGTPRYSSWRNREFEREFYNEHLEITRKNILKVVNRYKIGEKFTEVKLVDETAAEIIRKIGGWRELDILNANDSYFEVIRDEWNEEHKIVRCHKRYWEYVEPEKNYICNKPRKLMTTNEFCNVDLVTGKITG